MQVCISSLNNGNEKWQEINYMLQMIEEGYSFKFSLRVHTILSSILIFFIFNSTWSQKLSWSPHLKIKHVSQLPTVSLAPMFPTLCPFPSYQISLLVMFLIYMSVSLIVRAWHLFGNCSVCACACVCLLILVFWLECKFLETRTTFVSGISVFLVFTVPGTEMINSLLTKIMIRNH